MEEYIQIGKIVNTHGVRGEIKIIPLTDDPRRFENLKSVFVNRNQSRQAYDIKGVRYVKGFVTLSLRGIDNRDEAEKLKELSIEIYEKDAVKLPEGSYFIHDLIGLKAFDEKGDFLGTLCDVIQTGSNDCYSIRPENGNEYLIPAIKSVVLNVDIESKKIVIRIPDGLLDE